MLGSKRETIVAIITEFLIKSLSIHVISGFQVQSIQIAVYFVTTALVLLDSLTIKL